MADAAVLRMVLRQPLGILPVVDGGVLVGVITVAGIAEHLIDDGDLEAGGTWWPIEEHRPAPRAH